MTASAVTPSSLGLSSPCVLQRAPADWTASGDSEGQAFCYLIILSSSRFATGDCVGWSCECRTENGPVLSADIIGES